MGSTLKWLLGYGLDFNEWYGEDLLNSVIDLILKYELRKDSNFERIAYFRKLNADKDAIDAFTSNNDGFTPNINVSLLVKRGPGRLKDFKNKKTEY